MLIMFDDMISAMEANKSHIVTGLFMRDRKLNISLVFMSQIYFKMPKDIILNMTYYFIMKISNKREIQQIGLNHLPDTGFKDFMKLYKHFQQTMQFFHQIIYEDIARTYYKIAVNEKLIQSIIK